MHSAGGGSDILVSCHSGGGGLKTRKCAVQVGGRTLPLRWRWPEHKEMHSAGGGSDILVSCHSGGGGLKTRKCAVEVGGRTSRSFSTQVEVA